MCRHRLKRAGILYPKSLFQTTRHFGIRSLERGRRGFLRGPTADGLDCAYRGRLGRIGRQGVRNGGTKAKRGARYPRKVAPEFAGTRPRQAPEATGGSKGHLIVKGRDGPLT